MSSGSKFTGGNLKSRPLRWWWCCLAFVSPYPLWVGQPDRCRRGFSGSQLTMTISRSIRQARSKLKSFSTMLTTTGRSLRISGRPGVHEVCQRTPRSLQKVSPYSSPPFLDSLWEMCTKVMLRSILKLHTDPTLTISLKQLAGLLGPSYIVELSIHCIHTFCYIHNCTHIIAYY